MFLVNNEMAAARKETLKRAKAYRRAVRACREGDFRSLPSIGKTLVRMSRDNYAKAKAAENFS